jgi:tetratricopeptide (TPR) repeat protein
MLPALDPTVVAVAPYRVSAADTSLRYLREGVVDLLASRLAGTEALRPVESRVLLRAWRGTRGPGDDLTPAQAQALAVRLGAGWVIEGEIVGSGSRLTLSTRMLDVATLHPLAQETIESSVDSLPTLLDRLAARLLAIASGQPPHRLSILTGTSLPALRAYLNGEALDRRGFGDSAAQSFAEAIQVDSTFALAAMRLIQTTSWDSHGAVPIAWRYRDKLSVEDRANLRATLGPRYPAPTHYREGLAAADRLVLVAPDDPLAWIELGSGLFEDAPLLGLAEAHPRAAAAFARAVALDSANVPALSGLSVAATALGDTATARQALTLLRRQRRDSTSGIDFEAAWFLAAMTADTATLHQVLRRDSLGAARGTAHPGDAGRAMLRLGLQEGLDLRDARGVLERALGAAAINADRAGIRWNLAMLNGIRGRSDTTPGEPYWFGPAGLSVLPRSKDFARPILNFLFADLDSTGWARGGAALTRQLGSQRPAWCCLTRFAAGQYALTTNRLDLAERAAADLRTYHGPSPDEEGDTARGSEMSRELAAVLEAQIAARRHNPLATVRLRQLDSVLADPLEDLAPLLGNLVAAQLHEQRGELAEALAAVRRRWWGYWVDPVYVVYHREEGRLAALTGDTTAAIRAYRRYLALRGDAEPTLQPRVLQVRRSLAALERVARH